MDRPKNQLDIEALVADLKKLSDDVNLAELIRKEKFRSDTSNLDSLKPKTYLQKVLKNIFRNKSKKK